MKKAWRRGEAKAAKGRSGEIEGETEGEDMAEVVGQGKNELTARV
jgi:hypothetical protein